MKRGKRWLLAAATAGAMLTAIGCEAVQGVDVNRLLTAKTEIESLEGQLSLTWKLTPDDATMPDARAAAMIEALEEGALRVTAWKQATPREMSFEGTIALRKGSIPFAVYVDGTKVVIAVDGAKRPFALDLADSLGERLSLGGWIDGKQATSALAEEAGTKALRAVGAYLVGKTPTPANAAVSRVEETVGGDAKTLTKVRMTTPGDRIDDAMRTVAEAVLADEAGTKAVLGTLLDALGPALEESENPLLKLALENKSFAVDFLFVELERLLTDIRSRVAEGAEFTADSAVSVSVLADGLAPVGAELELDLSPADGRYGGVRRIEAKLVSRWWNANGDIAAERYVGATAPIERKSSPRRRLDNVKEGSLLYDVLKNDLALTTHAFGMYMGPNASVPDGISPYIKGEGTTMVPVRYVSEQLDATVEWDGEARTITIRDDVEGVTIEMAVDRNTATVNGAELPLPASPEIVFDSTFVPIAFITKALGGEVSWKDGIVTITKEF